MIQIVEAIIEPDGKVLLLEDVQLTESHRALVTILEDEPLSKASVTALLSEPSLAEDWNRTGGGRGMVSPSAGSVVLVTFPFSDLSQAKLRPAVVLAKANKNDWILCQITSNAYSDPRTVKLTDDNFSSRNAQDG